MNLKTLGGILLIIGTSIGGGMLALPISAAPGGFIHSSLLLLGCWVLMTFCAFLILEVNLWLPTQSNMISMAKATLGRVGAGIAWICYLLLFYCLLAAYISSGSDIFGHLLATLGWHAPDWLTALVFVVLLGYVVYQGIQSVDYVNRGLMFTKLGAYFLLVLTVIGYVDPIRLASGSPRYLVTAVTVMFTSFGFASIVPSLRSYYQDDLKQLRKVILIGSFIPLVCYILWDLAILGAVPHTGEDGLLRMLTSGHSTTDLQQALSYYNPWITLFAKVFTSVCVATSFLGVALGMSDFIADGLNLAKRGKGNLVVYTVTFLPPLLLSLFFPNAFILGLSYAGIFCVILLVIYPALMAWSGRYQKQLGKCYRVSGGRPALLGVLLIAALILAVGIHELA